MTATMSARSRASRTAAWMLDAAMGAGVWLLVWGIFSLMGFWHLPSDSRDRDIALNAQYRGGTVTAIAVEVHVDYESAEGGGWHEVDQVRVLLSENDQWRDLEAVANEDTLSEDRDWDEGWQPATEETGYSLPLTVMVTNDATGAVEHAVAERDVEYWTDDNADPEIDLGIGVGALLVGVGGAAGWKAWTDRRSSPVSAHYPGSTRADRRAERDREQQRKRADRKRERRR